MTEQLFCHIGEESKAMSDKEVRAMRPQDNRINVRIISDGTPFGTKIYDADTGERISQVKSINLHIDANYKNNN